MNRLPPHLAVKIKELRRSGRSQRQIAAECHVSTNTIRVHTAGIDPGSCECGKPATHRGWCRPRLATSPLRQEMLARKVMGESRWTWETDDLCMKLWEQGVEASVISMEINALLGRAVVGKKAVQVRAGQLGAKRPAGYQAGLVAARHRQRPNKAKWQAAIGAQSNVRKPTVVSVPSTKIGIPVAPVQAAPKPAFSMSVMRGPDPLREARQRQIAQAGVGRI